MNEDIKDKIIELIKKELEVYLKLGIKTKEEITFLGEDNFLKIEIEKNFIIAEDSNKIVVSEIDISTMVDLAMGTYNNMNSEFLIKSILKNKNIFIIEEGIEWRKYSKIPLILRDKYLTYEDNLKSYGIKIVKRFEILDVLENKEKDIEVFEKVLDEKKINNFITKKIKKIYVTRETIVTELAKDIIIKNNIEIIRR